MESVYDKVVKLTAEILKSWKPDPGVLSPFSSSSSSNSEQNDNHLEHYVKQGETSENSDVSSIFNSDLFTNGNKTMTEKTLDVETSSTTDSSYENAVNSTTEPDAQSEIAVTKAEETPAENIGTTSNTTEEAPAPGETAEPVEKAAEEPAAEPVAETAEPAAEKPAQEESKEIPAEENKKEPESEKSIWGGAFAPQIRGKL